MTVTLNGNNLASRLPQEWAETLMSKALQESVVGKLVASEPVPLNGKVIPVFDGGFEVASVAEAGRKPVSDSKISAKVMQPIKFAGILPVSREAARADSGRMLQAMTADMQNAVSRQVDMAVLYGKNALTGTDIVGATKVNATTNRVTLADGTDLVPQLLDGYALASEDGDGDPNGFAFDSRFRAKVALASQQQLAPAGGTQAMPNLGLATDYFAGLPTAFGRTVGGRVGNLATSGVNGFVGDWTKVRWGFSSNIELTRSDEASVVLGDGTTVNAFQDNVHLYRVEFELAWYVDEAAFAAFDAATSTPTPDPEG